MQENKQTETALEFKWLHDDELDVLEPIIRSRGWVPLNKGIAAAYVAYDHGQIVGFVALNCIPHVEPLWVSNERRGTGLAEELVNSMVEFLFSVQCPAAYIVADSPASARLAELHGMERVNVPVYRRIV